MIEGILIHSEYKVLIDTKFGLPTIMLKLLPLCLNVSAFIILAIILIEFFPSSNRKTTTNYKNKKIPPRSYLSRSARQYSTLSLTRKILLILWIERIFWNDFEGLLTGRVHLILNLNTKELISNLDLELICTLMIDRYYFLYIQD